MKNVSNNFKIDLRTFGRQLDVKFYADDTLIDTDNINYIKPSFNTSLFKTVMHQIEIDSKVFIPKKTKIEVELGIKVNEPNYEYIDFKTYYVKSCERQEDTNSYRILAYSKMQESMIDYDLEITDNITLREYLIQICQRLGWNTDNIPATFINSEKLVDPSLHKDIGYTFRDALDEIATLSCSFIYFENDDLYFSYITETNEVIDESYLDEDNVTIGEKYFVNSLVFSRAEGSDNIFRDDAVNIAMNGLHEYKISNCQLLSTNDRSDYIDDMFNYLKTLEFYIFDIKSKGILFFDVGDRFTFNLNNETYSTIMLNNEIEIEDGISESLYIDEPEETETEYKYADSTDKKINQTYIIVDKQNKKIESVVSKQTEQGQQISLMTQTISKIEQEVGDIADITITSEGTGTRTLENINESEPIYIRIYPTIDDVAFLYPSSKLYPGANTFLKNRNLIFQSGDYIVIYAIPTDLLIHEGVYDEFVLNYDTQECYVIHRIGLDENGDKYVLSEETREDFEYPVIPLQAGNYTIKLSSVDNAYMFIRLMASNIYTNQFATRVEMNNKITQTAEGTISEVNKTLESYPTNTQMNSVVNQTANQIMSNVSTTYATEDELTTAVSKFKQTTDEISSTVSRKVGKDEVISEINQSPEGIKIKADKIDIDGKAVHFKTNINETIGPFTEEDRQKAIAYIMGTGTLTQEEFERYDINGDGEINSGDTLFMSRAIANGGYYSFDGTYEINPYNSTKSLAIYNNNSAYYSAIISLMYNYFHQLDVRGLNINGQFVVEKDGINGSMSTQEDNGIFRLQLDGNIYCTKNITCDNLTQTSLEKKKKNFEKLQNGLNIVKETDIYKYNLKSEKNTDKKHIGFVIGKDYKYSSEITAEDGNGKEIGVDTYSMISVLWRAVQEQQEIIEDLQNQIKGGKE